MLLGRASIVCRRLPMPSSEVPLEDLAFGKLKARLKKATGSTTQLARPLFLYTPSFDALLDASGWDVVARRSYAPSIDWDTFRFHV